MAKRNKKNSGNEVALVLVALIGLMIRFIVKTVLIIFDFITIYTSGFKSKSGKGFIKTYFDKGNYGEFKLYKKAVRIFGKPYVYTNLYLENQNTDHTEVDVVAIASEGIYVFEMKNYSGYIYGSEKDDYWTQAFHKNSKHKFYNPLKQNYAHTKAVENYLEITSNEITPVIVFGNYATLSKVNISDKHNVIQLKKLGNLVRKSKKRNEKIYDLTNKQEIANKLILKSNMSEEVKQKHIEQVKLLQTNK